MFKGTGSMFSGSGLVRFPHYATGGIPQRRGLRNKRSAHNEKLKRQAAARLRDLEDTGTDWGEDNFGVNG